MAAPSVPRIEEAQEFDWDAEEADAGGEYTNGKHQSSKKKKKKGDAGDNMDPLVAIMMKDEVVELCSSLVAKLELIRYDDERSAVFRIPWISDLFHSCVERLAPGTMRGFNIEEWYNATISSDRPVSSGSKPDYRFSPALTKQPVQTNWLRPLFELEMQAPGFLKLFSNHLELEEKTQSKMAKGAKEDTEYNWLQTGSMSKSFPLAIEGGSGGTWAGNNFGTRRITQAPHTQRL